MFQILEYIFHRGHKKVFRRAHRGQNFDLIFFQKKTSARTFKYGHRAVCSGVLIGGVLMFSKLELLMRSFRVALQSCRQQCSPAVLQSCNRGTTDHRPQTTDHSKPQAVLATTSANGTESQWVWRAARFAALSTACSVRNPPVT